MEPPDLNRPAHDDQQLDAWLNANATSAPLPDDGFSQRVLHALPVRIDPAMLARMQHEARAEAWRRALFCAAGATAGVIVHLAHRSGGMNFSNFWHSLGGLSFDLREALSTMGTVSIVLASLALAYWEQLKTLQQNHA